MKTIGIIASLAVLSSLSGCFVTGDPQSSRNLETTMLRRDRYPEKGNDEQIEVYITKTPERPYDEIALLVSTRVDDVDNLDALRQEARQLGADAIILTGKAWSKRLYDSTIAPIVDYGMRAVAIKYR